MCVQLSWVSCVSWACTTPESWVWRVCEARSVSEFCICTVSSMYRTAAVSVSVSEPEAPPIRSIRLTYCCTLTFPMCWIADNNRSIRNVLSTTPCSKGTRSAGTVMISVLELLTRWGCELHEHESSCSSSLHLSSICVSCMMRIAGPVKGSAGQRPHGTKGTRSFLFHGLCSTGE